MKKSNKFLLVLIVIFLAAILGLVINFMVMNERKITAVNEAHEQSNVNYEQLLRNYELLTVNYEKLNENYLIVSSLKYADEKIIEKLTISYEQSIQNYNQLRENYNLLISSQQNDSTIINKIEEINKLETIEEMNFKNIHK